MLFRQAVRLGARARWIVGASMLALVGWIVFRGPAKSRRVPGVPQHRVNLGHGPDASVEPQRNPDRRQFQQLPLSFEPNQGQTDSQSSSFPEIRITTCS